MRLQVQQPVLAAPQITQTVEPHIATAIQTFAYAVIGAVQVAA
jgi:hypothetical protein